MKIVDKLQGHKDNINSIDIQEGLILTGSEDKTCRLWDLKSKKSLKCIIGNGPINISKFLNENQIITSISNRIYLYDLRNDKIILKDFEKELEIQKENEINDLKVRNENIYFIDDLGYFNILDKDLKIINSIEISKEMILNSFQFYKKEEIFFGGMDTKLFYSNLQKKKDIEISKNQNINPPYIYSMSMNENQSRLAIGLGNFKICLFNPNTQLVVDYLDHHEYIVNNLEYLNQNILISSGLDQKICVWESSKKKTKLNESLIHFSKVNVLKLSKNNEIFIGDLTNDLSIYSLSK